MISLNTRYVSLREELRPDVEDKKRTTVAGPDWPDHLQHRAWISPSGDLHDPGLQDTHESWLHHHSKLQAVKNHGADVEGKMLACPKHNNAFDSPWKCSDCLETQVKAGWIRKLTPEIYQTDGSPKQTLRVIRHYQSLHRDRNSDTLHIIHHGSQSNP